jgi:hypothetical protein
VSLVCNRGVAHSPRPTFAFQYFHNVVKGVIAKLIHVRTDAITCVPVRAALQVDNNVNRILDISCISCAILRSFFLPSSLQVNLRCHGPITHAKTHAE